MPTPPLRRPKVNAIRASSATLQDHFPKTVAFELGIEGRPYAVTGRRDLDGNALEPDLVVISGDGVLHHYRPSPGKPDGWLEERFDIPELRGAYITQLTASAMDVEAGGDQLVVSVVAAAADGRPMFRMYWRTADGWAELEPPRPPIGPDLLDVAVSSGFAGLARGKIQAYYATVQPERGLSLTGFGVLARGDMFSLFFEMRPGLDLLLGDENGYHVHIGRLQEGGLTLYTTRIEPQMIDWRNAVLPMHLDTEDRSRHVPLPIDLADVTQKEMRAIVDTAGIGRGVLVRSRDNRLACVRIGQGPGTDVVAELTGQPGGPERATETAAAVDRNGDFHLFVRDDAGLIWHALWRRDADSPSGWTPTGQLGARIEAPAMVGARPFVFVAEDDRIEMLAQGEPGDAWTRSSIAIPDPHVDADPALVHLVSISTFTVASDPVPGSPVHVRTSWPVIAENEGKLYRLGPDAAVPFVTGPAGSITFRIIANGTDAPAFLVSSPELPDVPEVACRPQQEALRRLAGLDDRFVVDGARLKAAGLAPATMPDADADQLAEILRKSATKALEDGATRPENGRLRSMLDYAPMEEPVAVRFTRANGPRATQIDGSDTMVMADTSFDMAWGDTAASFWSFLRSTWDKITDFVVEVVETGVRFVVQTVEKTVELVTQAARYIAEGVQAVIGWIGEMAGSAVEAAKKVTTWLAEKLGWGDVIRCKNLVRDYTLTTFTDLEVFIGRAVPDLISRGIGEAKQGVDRWFDEALGKLGGQQQTFKQGGVDPTRSRVQNNGPKILTFQNAVPQKPSPKPLFEFSPAITDKIKQVSEEARKIGEEERTRKLFEPISELFQGERSLSEAITSLTGEFLRALRGLVVFALDVADLLQRLILELAAGLIGLVRRGLTASVGALGGPFAWVNSLYKQISGGDDLSILDLGVLIFVTPGVLLYHLFAKKSVLPEQETLPEVVSSVSLLTAAITTPAQTDAPVMAANGSGTVFDRPEWTREWLSSLKGKAKSIYDWVNFVLEIVAPVWAFLRAVISLAENALRFGDLENPGVVVPGRTFFSTVVALGDNLPLITMIAGEVLFGYTSPANWAPENQTAEVLLGYVLLLICGVAIAACGVLIALIVKSEIRQAIGPNPAVFLDSYITLLTGAVMVVVNVVMIIYFLKFRKPESTADAEQRTTTRFWLTRSAGFVGSGRQTCAYILPLGWAITKGGGPAAPIGGAMVGAQMVLDSACYTVNGALLSVKAAA